MSWVDRYTQNLRITTGDSEVFELFTLPSFTKEIEYNASEFSFVDIDGDLIKKRKIKGRTFPLEFYFVGEDNIENAKSFEFSASHPDPWIIQHPYYDTILAQILSIKFDDTELNVTKVTCVAKETITDNGGERDDPNPTDTVLLKSIQLDALLSEPEISPSISDIDSIITTTEASYDEGVKIITLPQDAEDYFNAFNEATSTINNIIASPILAITALNSFLLMPSQFTANVQDRIRVLVNQIDNLRRTIVGLTTPTSKRIYQTQQSTLMSAMCVAAVTPLTGNYLNAKRASVISTTIKEKYEEFLEDIDGLQNANGGNPLFYVPDFNSMNALGDLVMLTVSSLFEIALAGRKEFTFTLTEDSNVILLTHRFYKLDKEDNNLTELIENNGLTYREIALGLKKGKSIFYYV